MIDAIHPSPAFTSSALPRTICKFRHASCNSAPPLEVRKAFHNTHEWKWHPHVLPYISKVNYPLILSFTATHKICLPINHSIGQNTAAKNYISFFNADSFAWYTPQNIFLSDLRVGLSCPRPRTPHLPASWCTQIPLQSSDHLETFCSINKLSSFFLTRIFSAHFYTQWACFPLLLTAVTTAGSSEESFWVNFTPHTLPAQNLTKDYGPTSMFPQCFVS